MTLSLKPKAFYAALFALAFSANIFAQDAAPVTVDGLVLIEDSDVDIAYLKPNADFSNYTKFMINMAEVKFQKDWERDMRRMGSSRLRISDRDKEKIIKNLSDLLYDTFTEELQKYDNFLVVNQPGEDVLALNVSIIDLYITAPDLNSSARTQSYVANAGSMVLVGELIDSTSGEVLARFADGQAARDNVGMQFSNSVFNQREGRIILRGWAQLLREDMEKIHGLTD